MDITLTDHPAQAKCAITHKPAVDAQGKPVPLCPDQKAIRASGVLIGYVGTWDGAPVNLIRHLPEWQRELVLEFVKKTLNPGFVTSVPDPKTVTPIDDEDDEDEDEMEEDDTDALEESPE